MIKKRINHRQKMISDELNVIYGNGDEAPQDLNLNHLVKPNRRSLSRLFIKIFIILSVLSILAWTGYFILGHPFTRSSEEPLLLTIETPSQVRSGEETTVMIRYENRGAAPIAAFGFTLEMPDSFWLTEADPEPTEGENDWTIGAISAGSDGAVSVKGIWTADVPSVQRLQAIGRYKPANFNSDFQTIATAAVQIADSTMIMTADSPIEAKAGQLVTYRFDVKNEGGAAWGDSRLRLSLPDGFRVTETDPSLPETGSEWLIGPLSPDGLFTLIVSGSFAIDATGRQEITATAGVWREAAFVEQTRLSQATEVAASETDLTLIINGSTLDQTIIPDDALRVSISHNFKDESAALKLKLSELGAASIDWSSADLDGGKRYDDSIIEWTGQNQADLTLPVLAGRSYADVIEFQAVLEAEEETIHTTPITIRVNSDISFTSEARYNLEEAVVGAGPFPPIVGQKTTFRIIWTIAHTTHSLSEIELTGTIPPGVTFETLQETDAGILTYKEETREIFWKIERLEENEKEISAHFDLSVVPDEEDVGSFLKLTNAARLSLKDDETGDTIEQEGESLSTDLTDVEAEGEGIVKKL